MIAYFARFRWRVLLLGGLALFTLLSLLLATHLLAGPRESDTAPALSVPTSPSGSSSSAFTPISTTEARQQIKFVTSLCRDHQGRVWIGTEDQGVWRYDPTAPVNAAYLHFAAADGPGDDTVYALACDLRGRIWAGTLNHGVAVFNGREWRRFAPPDGPLGCRVFALAVCPTTGGVWMATEAGLARYEQGQWAYYTRANGLPSDEATALAFAPNGALYVGTQCDGIAIASPRNGYATWRVVPGPASTPQTLRGAGLPSGMINCLRVTASGAAWAGTTEGLAHSGDGGHTWHFRRGGDWQDKGYKGFTSGYADFPKINGIEVIPASGGAFAVHASGKAEGRFLAPRGFTGGRFISTGRRIDTSHVPGPAPEAVYQDERYGDCVFTASHLKPRGPCHVRLHFSDIIFTEPKKRLFDVSINGKRVLDHFDIFKEAGAIDRAVVRGFAARADANGRLQITFSGAAPGQDDAGLGEDYVTCLADDGAGHLLIGHRQQAPEMLDLKTGTHQALGPSAYVNALLPLSPGTALMGDYGGGLSMQSVKDLRGPALTRAAPEAVAALPAPLAPPGLTQLNAMLAEVGHVAPDPQELQPHVTALADDWLTQGDWLGRYGRYWACLAALFHPIPEDYVWGAGWEPVDYRLTMGPNHDHGDSLRYWLQWRYTDNPRVLEMPTAYAHSRVLRGYTTWKLDRRETEVDDHGESYPPAMDGPNIYATLTVPDGLYYLSLYDYNKDGHTDENVNRDYRLSLRAHPGGALGNVNGFHQQPELTHGRLRDFWGGVWKRFLVRGPLTLSVEVNRNNSHNVILPAAMLDLVDEDPAPYFQTVDAWNLREVDRTQERRALTAPKHLTAPRSRPAATEPEAADRLFSALEETRLTRSAWWATEGRRYYAPLLRWYGIATPKAAPGPPTRLALRLATCRYQLGQYAAWEEEQKAAHLVTARDVEKSLRWDGVTTSYSGLGNEIVTAHLVGQKVQQVSRSR